MCWLSLYCDLDDTTKLPPDVPSILGVLEIRDHVTDRKHFARRRVTLDEKFPRVSNLLLARDVDAVFQVPVDVRCLLAPYCHGHEQLGQARHLVKGPKL